MFQAESVVGDKPGDEGEISLPMRRKLQGLCPRCGQPAQEAADVCRACRIALNAIQRSFRLRRREAGKCVDCGKRAKHRRCAACARLHAENRSRVISARSRVDQTPDPAHSKVVAKVETDGKTRYRFTGRGRRGAPSLREIEFDDVRGLEFGMREWGKAIPLLVEAGELSTDLPRIQRAARRREALAPLGLAIRLGLEVMRRNGMDTESFERVDDDDDLDE